MEAEAFNRLRWRCVRRGMLEVDIALTRFLDSSFATLSEAGQQAFAELADFDDLELWHLISGQKVCEDARLAAIVAMLRAPVDSVPVT
ncbi:MAG: succinate dehydrogenase assembly factor 2 [Zoogloeaceae bacterium]|jgi:succinate dehydrogenase flavin-adding protein (antitoxin of CptAB toxin-antitoxin module)|nr:succinate dehydrogenase assembly factor 2 [Zoogloeaceae bacterium]